MWKVSVRNLRAHKLRLALTVLAVLLGTAFIAGSMMFTNMLGRTFESAVATQYEAADVVVEQGESGKDLSQAQLEQLQQRDDVARVNLFGSRTVVVADATKEAFQTHQGTARAGIYYSQADAPRSDVVLVTGEEPSARNEVVVNANGAQRYGVGVGDELIVADPNSQHTVVVTGLYEDPVVQETSLRVLMSPEGYSSAFWSEGWFDAVSLQAQGTTAEDLRDAVAQELPGHKVRTGAEAAQEASESVREALNFVNYFLVAFGLVGLLVGTFLIANTFAMIVAQRTKEFALLRALGASRGQVTRSVALEAVVVGLLGSALGVIAGVGLVAAIRVVMARNEMPLPEGGLGLSASAVFIPIVVGVIVTLISAWAPARKAGRVEPVAAMRSTEAATAQPLKVRTVLGVLCLLVALLAGTWGLLWEDAATSRRAILVGVAAVAAIAGLFMAGPALSLPIVPPLGRLLGLPFGMAGKLAATNTQRNPRRTATTAFALMLGIALVTLIGMFGTTMKHSVADVSENEVSAEYVLMGPEMGAFPIPQDLMQRLPEVDGVGDVVAYTEGPLTVNGEFSYTLGDYGTTPVLFGDPAKLVELTMLDGVSDPDQGLLVPEAVAQERGLRVGDIAKVAAPAVGDAAIDVPVAGIFAPSSVLTGIVVGSEFATQLLPASAMNIIMLGVNGDGSVPLEQLRTNLVDEVRDDIVVQVKSTEEISGEVLALIDQMLFILYALLSLAVVIAVLGIVNTLTLSVIERRQEIGMLRAIGTQRGQVRTMIILESVQMAVFGAVLGTVLGLVLGWTFLTVLEDQGIKDIVVPGELVGLTLAGAFVVGRVAALWPAQRAAATPPLEAIAE